jgi:hypothetical protein
MRRGGPARACSLDVESVVETVGPPRREDGENDFVGSPLDEVADAVCVRVPCGLQRPVGAERDAIEVGHSIAPMNLARSFPPRSGRASFASLCREACLMQARVQP